MRLLARMALALVFKLVLALLVGFTSGFHLAHTAGGYLIPRQRETFTDILTQHLETVALLSQRNTTFSLLIRNCQTKITIYPERRYAEQGRFYTVVPGGTVVDIAKDYNVNLHCVLSKDNPLADSSPIDPGDCVSIPNDCPPCSTVVLFRI